MLKNKVKLDLSCRDCCHSEQTDATCELCKRGRELGHNQWLQICSNHQRAENAGSIVAQLRPSWLFMQPTLGSNTATTQLNTSQHAVQCCSTLLNNTVQHPLSPPHNNGPAASSSPSSAPLQFKLQEPHIVEKHGRIPAFQRSTFQTSPLQYPLSRAITAKQHCSSNRPTFSRTN